MPSDRDARRIAQQRMVEAMARHSSYLHRAATAQVNEMREAVDKLGAELARSLSDRLDNLSPAELQAFAQGRYHTDRLKGLRKTIDQWAASLGTQIDTLAKSGFEELAGHEADYARRMLGEVLEDDLPKAPTAAAAYGAAMRSPVLGEMVDEMLSAIPERTRQQVYSAVRQGIAQGQTNSEIVRALRGTRALQYRDGILQQTRNSVERVVRTGRNHVSNVAYEETYAALGVEELVWTSTLDGRTSEICASRDGQRYKVGENHPKPPAHPNCRSVLAPSLDGEVMGRRPYVRAFKPVGQIPKGERPADMIGQVAPGTTYAKWFDRQPASFQKEWLGPTRYELYRKGDYSISRFVDPTGKKLTLAELRERDKSTFAELFGESARA